MRSPMVCLLRFAPLERYAYTDLNVAGRHLRAGQSALSQASWEGRPDQTVQPTFDGHQVDSEWNRVTRSPLRSEPPVQETSNLRVFPGQLLSLCNSAQPQNRQPEDSLSQPSYAQQASAHTGPVDRSASVVPQLGKHITQSHPHNNPNASVCSFIRLPAPAYNARIAPSRSRTIKRPSSSFHPRLLTPPPPAESLLFPPSPTYALRPATFARLSPLSISLRPPEFDASPSAMPSQAGDDHVQHSTIIATGAQGRAALASGFGTSSSRRE
jgi:hypothetical protein